MPDAALAAVTPTPNTPFVAPAGATTVVNLPMRQSTRTLLLLVGGFANVTALSLTGGATATPYLTLTAAPAGGVFVLPVAGSIETDVSLSVTCGAGGSALVFAAEDASPWSINGQLSANGTGLPAGQALMAASIPVAIASDQSAITANIGAQASGVQGNLWNNVVVGAGGVSNGATGVAQRVAAFFGHVSAATTINLQLSKDNVNWYTVDSTVLAGASDFGFYSKLIPAGTAMRLQSTAAATITATLSLSA